MKLKTLIWKKDLQKTVSIGIIMEIDIIYRGRPEPTLVLEFSIVAEAIMGIIVEVKMSMIMISNLR